MGEADSITGQLLVTYLLHTIQDPFCTATQFSFEKIFTLLSLLFGGPSLSITDQG